MYESVLKRVKRRLLHKEKSIKKHTDIYAFGASDQSRNVIRLLAERGITVKNIIDNNPGKQGMYCAGIKVIPPEAIEEIADRNNAYIICSAFWREMKKQLLNEGVLIDHIYVLPYEKSYEYFSVYSLYKAYKGKKIYQYILRKYKLQNILVCPYTGTGDIYLIGALLDYYLKKNNIDDYVLVVVSVACKKVAQLFGIKNIYVLQSTDECSYLMKYYLFCEKECQLTILNDCWSEVYTNRTEWVRGLHGMNFTDMFRKFVFDLDDEVKPIAPSITSEDEQVHEIFRKYDLKVGKTVVLSPYSNTLADLPMNFWEELAERLIEKGYSVCTNSSKPSEPAVKGTTAVFFPFNIAIPFVNEAGGFIGVRSGFCDVISSCNAKKVILYDKYNNFYNCSAYDYFSLNKMGLCDDAAEIQYDNNKANEYMDLIISCFL